ncbi:MAG: formate acetyltransferase, partial [Clostridiales bacterium]|nr:formate acetyltransferase [Clostridiales bacterium]
MYKDNGNFNQGNWNNVIDVQDFIVRNYTPYYGDEAFLAGPTQRVISLNNIYEGLLKKEKDKGGVLDIDTSEVALLTYPPGYVDKENEIIVGLQTNEPLKRGINPFGGIRMVEQSCRQYGYELSENVKQWFKYKTTHNDGVFRVYTDEMRKVRSSGVITGLPDAYGRGRIIGDYRRVALYGVDYLVNEKQKDKVIYGNNPMNEENIKLLEELYRQIDFLLKLKDMAASYEVDISNPAQNARQAAQWIYFAYLAAIKEQNGAAMSLGRVSTFLDIYFERDLKDGTLDETQAQEIVDQFVLKLRMARQLRTEDYNELFAGDPMWITESIGGMAQDGRTLVTKTSFRFLHTLYNLNPSPEPNLTILWSSKLPEAFKKYCAKVTIDTDSIQYENDDLMRNRYGDDYGIACCVSAMKIGKQMQFFGARCNLAKVLLMALNGGRDEISGKQVGPVMEPIRDDILDFDEVMERFKFYI